MWAVVNKKDVVNTVVNTTNTVVNRLPKADASGLEAVDAASRQTEWQRSNRDRYNARMRDYMRRRRAGGSSGIVPVGKGTVE